MVLNIENHTEARIDLVSDKIRDSQSQKKHDATFYNSFISIKLDS